MTSLFRTFVLALLGIVFAIYGICHAVTSYPDPQVFTTFGQELPTIGAVVSFGCGLTAALLGLLLLIPVALRLSRRSQARKVPLYAGTASSRPAPDRHEEDYEFEPEVDPYDSGPQEQEYDRNRGRRGYDGYPGPAGAYGPSAGRNNRPDHRPVAGARR